MKRYFLPLKYLIFFSCAALIPGLLAAASALSFTIPEQLRYDLMWTGIKAGEASFEIREQGPYIQFLSTTTSAKWVSIFYTVDDMVASTLKKNGRGEYYGNFVGVPYAYRINLREGKHRRDKEFIFNHAQKKVIYINHLKKEVLDFKLEGQVFDPLSCFYYLRGLPLTPGKPVYITIFDNKKTYPLEIQVLSRETIKIPLGMFKTILIKPVMKSEGIFNKKGDILIWLTDDEKKIPVVAKTKVMLGSVKAVLAGGVY